MSFHRIILRAFALVVAMSAGGGISHAAALGRAMPLGASTLAPSGYVEFCRRQPQDCGLSAAPAPTAMGATPWAEIFAASAPAASAAKAPAEAVAQPKLGPGLWGKLNEVNARVNRAIAPQTDEAQFGVGDLWQMPLQAGRAAGDCEDYALEKRRALIAEGLSPALLNFAVALTAAGETHAVLVVSTADGDFVLDNLSHSVARWDALPYRWLSREVGGDPFRWAMVKPPAKSARS